MHEQVLTNGVTLHVVSEGERGAPLVVLLHGFPEFWWCWRKQIEPLVGRGFRVVAPDQRGYNQSDKPKGVRSYHIDRLAEDVVGLIDREGAQKAYVVGHDWGGIVGWWVALRHPSRVDKLVAINGPNPQVLAKQIMTTFRQLKKSWYALFFQIPRLPEKMAFLDEGGRAMAEVLEKTSRPGTFSPDELERYREAWAQPGAPTAMINWYRAAFGDIVRQAFSQPERITVPTMLVWGVLDVSLGIELAQPSVDQCDEGRLERIEDGSHWVHHEQPERISALIADFLGSAASSVR